MTQPNFPQELGLLKDLTESLDCLHDAQILQLKQWGALALPHVKPGNWECRVDQDNRTISYVILPTNAKGKKHPKNFASLIAALDNSILFMLGPTWKVEVYRAQNLIYNGPRRMTKEQYAEQRREERERRNLATATPKAD